MNTNEPREPLSTEGGQFGDDEHVEVLVEDLFIEDFPAAAPPEPNRGRLARVVRPLRGHKKSLFAGLVALGGLALVTLLFGRRRRTRLQRVLYKLGFAS